MLENEVKESDTLQVTDKKKKSKDSTEKKHNRFWSAIMVKLQTLGKALIYPIAVLPFAALLNRFGSLAMELNPVHDGVKNAGYWFGFIFAQPGGTIFNNIALVFAIGVAFGFAKDHRGECALVGAVFYLILVAFLAQGGVPELLYKNVLTFDVNTINHTYDPTTGAVLSDTGSTVTDHLSRLFYVKAYSVYSGPNSTNGGLMATGGTYILDIGVLGGIVAGGTSAYMYNKFKGIKLPMALSFFGGRRFIPMMLMVISWPVAFLFAVIWPWFQFALVTFGETISSGDAWTIPGAFIYGLLNRFMQPFGLHHILNTFLWFQLPIEGQMVSAINGKIVLTNEMINTYLNADGTDIANFSAFTDYLNGIISGCGLHIKQFTLDQSTNVIGNSDGEWTKWFTLNLSKIKDSEGTIILKDPTLATAYVFGDINAFQKSLISGTFQTGYFPLYWGGLTAASAAMVMAAPKARRKQVATFFVGIGAVSALTGIDEPVFFAFTFVGPILWVYNAFFTATFCAIGVSMHMHIGFGFSAGLIDYIISFATSWGMSKWEGVTNGSVYGILSNPLWMFALALLMAPCYYFSFYFTIKKMDIKTPGREDEGGNEVPGMNDPSAAPKKEKGAKSNRDAKYQKIAETIVNLIGAENIITVDNCSSRIRLEINDNSQLNEADFKAAGAYGIKKMGKNGFQVVVGTDCEPVTDLIHEMIGR